MSDQKSDANGSEGESEHQEASSQDNPPSAQKSGSSDISSETSEAVETGNGQTKDNEADAGTSADGVDSHHLHRPNRIPNRKKFPTLN